MFDKQADECSLHLFIPVLNTPITTTRGAPLFQSPRVTSFNSNDSKTKSSRLGRPVCARRQRQGISR